MSRDPSVLDEPAACPGCGQEVFSKVVHAYGSAYLRTVFHVARCGRPCRTWFSVAAMYGGEDYIAARDAATLSLARGEPKNYFCDCETFAACERRGEERAA